MASHAFYIPLDNVIARAREAGCSVFTVSSFVFLIFPSGYCLSIPARDINLLRFDLRISFLGPIEDQNPRAPFRYRRVSRYVHHVVLPNSVFNFILTRILHFGSFQLQNSHHKLTDCVQLDASL
jgi:hypothetical protein